MQLICLSMSRLNKAIQMFSHNSYPQLMGCAPCNLYHHPPRGEPLISTPLEGCTAHITPSLMYLSIMRDAPLMLPRSLMYLSIHVQVEQSNADVFAQQLSTANGVRSMQPIPPPPDRDAPDAPPLSEERQQQMLKAHEMKSTWSDDHARYYDSVSYVVSVLFSEHLVSSICMCFIKPRPPVV